MHRPLCFLDSDRKSQRSIQPLPDGSRTGDFDSGMLAFLSISSHTQAFIDALSSQGGEPLYKLSYPAARKVLEDFQATPVAKLPADIDEKVLPVGLRREAGAQPPWARLHVTEWSPVREKLPFVLRCSSKASFCRV
jgi:hypothetical protein